jgi:hypothetical protein
MVWWGLDNVRSKDGVDIFCQVPVLQSLAYRVTNIGDDLCSELTSPKNWSDKYASSSWVALPYTCQKQIYVVDVVNLLHKSWNTGHEDVLIMLNNNAEVNAMFTASHESLSPQSTGVRRE